MEALRDKNGGLVHFFYSCLFLFLNEKQAVTFVVGKSWLMGRSLWCAGSFILSLHLFRIKGYIFVVPDRILLLARDGAGVVSRTFSTGNRMGQIYSLNICFTYYGTFQQQSNQLFCWFLKDNPLIFRLFQNFSIPLPAIRYISCQEMKTIGNNKCVVFNKKKDDGLR